METTIKGAPLAQTTKPVETAKKHSVTLVLVCDGVTVATLPTDAKVFKSGKRGYGHYGKAALPNGERLQMSCNMVVIGS